MEGRIKARIEKGKVWTGPDGRGEAGEARRGMRRIAILGFAYDGEGFRPEGWEPWLINNCPPWAEALGVVPARAFQLHPRSTLSPPEVAWLERWRCPVYVHEAHLAEYAGQVKDLCRYPSSELHEAFGLPIPWQMGSSFSWAVAMACYEFAQAQRPPTTLTLVGMALTAGTPRERLVEHAALQWWLGFAAGLGMVVEWPRESDLRGSPYGYGLDYWREAEWAESRVRQYARALVRYGLVGEVSDYGTLTRETNTRESHFHRCPTEGHDPWPCNTPSCATTRDRFCPTCRRVEARRS